MRLVFLLVTLALASCKLAVIVVEGGSVQSTASGSCDAPAVCSHSIPDTTYIESFTAVPDPGWRFVRWNGGGGFICKDSTRPVCTADTTPFAGDTVIEQVIASEATVYAMPVFERNLVTETVTVDGREWAQVLLFSGVAYADIEAACPANPCPSGALLNNIDIAGWHWATLAEVGDLFGLLTPHPGGADVYSQIFFGDFTWAHEFFTVVGFEPTYAFTDDFTRSVSGYVRGPAAIAEPVAYLFVAAPGEPNAVADTRGIAPCCGLATLNIGAWFYR